MHTLESLLKQSEKLPSLPEIYIRVSELLEAQNSTAQEIGQAVQTDPSLTTRILKMINSAYYGLPNQVTSISQAVSLLGRNLLKQILVGSVVAGIFSEIHIPGFSMREFWLHSIRTAIIGRHLAMQNAAIIDHEAFFTAGLLHDIGKLILAKAEPELTAEIHTLAQAQDKSTIELESYKIGVTHVDVGVELMHSWGMPSLLTICLKKHHLQDHTGPFSIETCIVYLANRLSKQDLVENEEEMAQLLKCIPNWQQSECTLGQIVVACQLAHEQEREVLESLCMVDLEIED